MGRVTRWCGSNLAGSRRRRLESPSVAGLEGVLQRRGGAGGCGEQRGSVRRMQRDWGQGKHLAAGCRAVAGRSGGAGCPAPCRGCCSRRKRGRGFECEWRDELTELGFDYCLWGQMGLFGFIHTLECGAERLAWEGS